LEYYFFSVQTQLLWRTRHPHPAAVLWPCCVHCASFCAWPNGRLIINSVIVSLALNWQAERRASGEGEGRKGFSTGPSKYRFVFTFASASFCRNYQIACPSSPNSSWQMAPSKKLWPLFSKPGQTNCKALGIETYLHSCPSSENKTKIAQGPSVDSAVPLSKCQMLHVIKIRSIGRMSGPRGHSQIGIAGGALSWLIFPIWVISTSKHWGWKKSNNDIRMAK